MPIGNRSREKQIEEIILLSSDSDSDVDVRHDSPDEDYNRAGPSRRSIGARAGPSLINNRASSSHLNSRNGNDSDVEDSNSRRTRTKFTRKQDKALLKYMTRGFRYLWPKDLSIYADAGKEDESLSSITTHTLMSRFNDVVRSGRYMSRTSSLGKKALLKLAFVYTATDQEMVARRKHFKVRYSALRGFIENNSRAEPEITDESETDQSTSHPVVCRSTSSGSDSDSSDHEKNKRNNRDDASVIPRRRSPRKLRRTSEIETRSSESDSDKSGDDASDILHRSPGKPQQTPEIKTRNSRKSVNQRPNYKEVAISDSESSDSDVTKGINWVDSPDFIGEWSTKRKSKRTTYTKSKKTDRSKINFGTPERSSKSKKGSTSSKESNKTSDSDSDSETEGKNSNNCRKKSSSFDIKKAGGSKVSNSPSKSRTGKGNASNSDSSTGERDDSRNFQGPSKSKKTSTSAKKPDTNSDSGSDSDAERKNSNNLKTKSVNSGAKKGVQKKFTTTRLESSTKNKAKLAKETGNSSNFQESSNLKNSTPAEKSNKNSHPEPNSDADKKNSNSSLVKKQCLSTWRKRGRNGKFIKNRVIPSTTKNKNNQTNSSSSKKSSDIRKQVLADSSEEGENSGSSRQSSKSERNLNNHDGKKSKGKSSEDSGSDYETSNSSIQAPRPQHGASSKKTEENSDSESENNKPKSLKIILSPENPTGSTNIAGKKLDLDKSTSTGKTNNVPDKSKTEKIGTKASIEKSSDSSDSIASQPAKKSVDKKHDGVLSENLTKSSTKPVGKSKKPADESGSDTESTRTTVVSRTNYAAHSQKTDQKELELKKSQKSESKCDENGEGKEKPVKDSGCESGDSDSKSSSVEISKCARTSPPPQLLELSTERAKEQLTSEKSKIKTSGEKSKKPEAEVKNKEPESSKVSKDTLRSPPQPQPPACREKVTEKLASEKFQTKPCSEIRNKSVENSVQASESEGGRHNKAVSPPRPSSSEKLIEEKFDESKTYKIETSGNKSKTEEMKKPNKRKNDSGEKDKKESDLGEPPSKKPAPVLKSDAEKNYSVKIRKVSWKKNSNPLSRLEPSVRAKVRDILKKLRGFSYYS